MAARPAHSVFQYIKYNLMQIDNINLKKSRRTFLYATLLVSPRLAMSKAFLACDQKRFYGCDKSREIKKNSKIFSEILCMWLAVTFFCKNSQFFRANALLGVFIGEY